MTRDSNSAPKGPEAWKPIAGFEGRYEVSSHGGVRSISRLQKTDRGARNLTGTILKPSIDSHGYPSVSLRRDGIRRVLRVHRLVAEAFLPPAAPFQNQVAHLDGTPTHNWASNLKWASNAENSAHKLMHGTHQAREKHPRSRLTEEQVADLRAQHEAGLRVATLARKFDLSWSQAKRIAIGERWCEAAQSGPRRGASPDHNNTFQVDPKDFTPSGETSDLVERSAVLSIVADFDTLVDRVEALPAIPDAATILPEKTGELDGKGWVFWNPDASEEYAQQHPIESGECCDAERVRKSTGQEDCLWDAFQAQFARAEAAEQEVARLTGERDLIVAWLRAHSDEEPTILLLAERVEAGEHLPLRGAAIRARAALNPTAGDDASPNDPDLGKIGPGHICKHDVRWPHPCNACDAAAWRAHCASPNDGGEG